MTARILTEYGKHGDFVYDASTDELLAKACLTIIKDRLDSRWYDPGTPPDEETVTLARMTKEELATVPGPLYDTTKRARASAKGRVNWYTEQRERQDEAVALTTSGHYVVDSDTTSPYRTVPAYRFLADNSDGEYERVELSTPRAAEWEWA
jgi:hypothetical protein